MAVVRADCPAMPCGGAGWCRLCGLFVLSNNVVVVVVVVVDAVVVLVFFVLFRVF